MKRILAVIAVAGAVLGLASCSSMPSWMPGSGAMKVNLSGAEEVPPVNTQAKGSGSFRVDKEGNVSGSVTTEGVTGTMAHLHQAAKGANGPVIVPLEKKGDSTWAVPEGKKLTQAQIDALKAGNVYVNVHSAAHKGGEIRAQLQP